VTTETKDVQAMRWVRTTPLMDEMEAWEAPTIGARIALHMDGWRARIGRRQRGRFATFGEASKWVRSWRHG
jgi:hypothetical protein